MNIEAPTLPACLSHLAQRDTAAHARLLETLRRKEATSADVALQLRNVTLERHRLVERVADLEAELARRAADAAGYIAGLEAAERACMERSAAHRAEVDRWPDESDRAACLHDALEALGCAADIKSLRVAAQRESANV